MKKFMMIVAAGTLGMMATSAHAMPNVARAPIPAITTAQPETPHVTTVEYRDHRRMLRKKYHSNRHWHRHWHGGRHDRYDAYRGWNRYSHRPHSWRSRGCVSVGPIWFCP